MLFSRPPLPFVISPCYLHHRHSHHHHSTIHTPVGASWNADPHCRQLPLLPLLSNAYLLPSTHHRLAINHCRCHTPPPLSSNAILVTVASPPPHGRHSLQPQLNAIVILHCHGCYCCPSPPANADTRRCHLPPLVSKAILASPSPHHSPSPLPSNSTKLWHHHWAPPSPSPLNAFSIVHCCWHCRCPCHCRRCRRRH